MLWSRDEYIKLMRFEPSEREMHVELFGLPEGLAKEWSEQGANEAEARLTGFSFDNVARIECGANLGRIYAPEPCILKAGEERIVFRDSLGRIVERSARGGARRVLEYPVKTLEDWLDIKHHYIFDSSRVDYMLASHAFEVQQCGALVVARIQGGIQLACELMGAEGAARALVAQRDLINDMMTTLTDTCLRALEEVTCTVNVDNLVLDGDSRGTDIAILSPDIVREYLRPYYMAVWEYASAHGTQLFSLTTPGNVSHIAEALVESGVNVFSPCTAANGVDMVELRKRLGHRVAFKGGIDSRILHGTRADIDAELEYKLQPLMRAGGVCFGLDGRIPHGTPFEAYRYYVTRTREMLGIPLNQVPMWGKMDF